MNKYVYKNSVSLFIALLLALFSCKNEEILKCDILIKNGLGIAIILKNK